MGLVPTVKVVKEDADRGYMIIAEEDYDPDEHTLYDQEVEYELARNGYWTLYVGGDEEGSGRGIERLEEALDDHGASLESAQEI